MADDFKSTMCIVFVGYLSAIIAANRVAAGPQRGDFEFPSVVNCNCSSTGGDDGSFDEGNRGTRYPNEEIVAFNETDSESTIDNESREFFLTNIVESMFSAVASGIGSIVTSIIGTEKNFKSRTSRISYKNHQLVRLYPNSQEHVNDLKELEESEPENVKFWTEPMYNRTTDVVVGPDLVSDLKVFLRDKRIDFKVLIPDLQKTIAHQNPKMTKEQRNDLVTTNGHSMTWKRYHRYGEIVKYLEYLELRYPSIAEVITIGHSYEGQPINMIKISTGMNKDGEAKPAIWIDAGMHAREWIGSAVATYIVSQLVEKNSIYAKLLNNTDWMILPVVNPDGYEFSHTGDRLWRKTRSNHAEDEDDSRFLQLVNHYTRWLWGKCEGVDPNRNFDYHWGEMEEGGASLDPCHETYAGPRAFSEPETKAMADYILANKQNIRVYLTLHSYSQMWLVPWGYTYTKPSDYSELASVAKKAIGAVTKIHGTDYQVGPSADLLYPTSGASDDWAKGVAGIKYAYTLELRDRVCWAVPTGNLHPRITDGVAAARGEFPYQVSIQYGTPPLIKFSHACGGSILNERTILTAGHCILSNRKVRVVVGKYQLNAEESTQQIVDVARSVVHSGYKGGVAQHDIALMFLSQPLKLNNAVQPVSLPTQGQKQTGQAVLSGWGSTSKSIFPSMPNVLQKAVVPILDNAECYRELTAQPVSGQKPELFDTQVCSGIAGKEVSACSGDSGGPLAQNVGGKHIQVGIVSWGMMPCGSSHMPSVYTRVSSYIDWIHSQLK